jgi:hypothetical protein
MSTTKLPVLPSDCCAPAVQATCCAATEKTECCGSDVSAGGCGCAAGKQPSDPRDPTPRQAP